jgi:hypothetical protein
MFQKTTADLKQKRLQTPVVEPERDETAQPGPLDLGVFSSSSDPAEAARALVEKTNGRPARAGSRLLQLQKQYGNRHVQRQVVQAKMLLGPVGDKYEQEADRVAQEVVRSKGKPEPAAIRQPMGDSGTAVTSDVKSANIQRYSIDFTVNPGPGAATQFKISFTFDTTSSIGSRNYSEISSQGIGLTSSWDKVRSSMRSIRMINRQAGSGQMTRVSVSIQSAG